MNRLADKAREGFLGGDIAWDTDEFRVVLLDATYAFDAAHDFLDDVASSARVATSGALTGKTITSGVADAADVTFTALPSGDTITQLWVVKWTGVEATSNLVAYFDTKADTTAINVITNGGDVVVVWSNGANRIFKL
jgi:ApbE superfamily uncharacterized protein (UPF0280 family)